MGLHMLEKQKHCHYMRGMECEKNDIIIHSECSIIWLLSIYFLIDKIRQNANLAYFFGRSVHQTDITLY